MQGDGGPAFPVSYGPDGTPGYSGGMTLRQWYAGQALAGLTREAFRYMVERPEGDSAEHPVLTDNALAVLREIGTVALSLADAMIAAERARQTDTEDTDD